MVDVVGPRSLSSRNMAATTHSPCAPGFGGGGVGDEYMDRRPASGLRLLISSPPITVSPPTQWIAFPRARTSRDVCATSMTFPSTSPDLGPPGTYLRSRLRSRRGPSTLGPSQISGTWSISGDALACRDFGGSRTRRGGRCKRARGLCIIFR
ncbi:hypothetical protein BD626DRAFT_160249 [Schizophyllum amplum]|uniref:Uncharacterized protein n=1 Tax=Schizophyllum amplum TaxID=97359 RepID=A0A550CP18_9AGAR|nr:hypothetical protein BD626DRAFT_160249 [Auriculariopsis ampla]